MNFCLKTIAVPIYKWLMAVIKLYEITVKNLKEETRYERRHKNRISNLQLIEYNNGTRTKCVDQLLGRIDFQFKCTNVYHREVEGMGKITGNKTTYNFLQFFILQQCLYRRRRESVSDSAHGCFGIECFPWVKHIILKNSIYIVSIYWSIKICWMWKNLMEYIKKWIWKNKYIHIKSKVNIVHKLMRPILTSVHKTRTDRRKIMQMTERQKL